MTGSNIEFVLKATIIIIVDYIYTYKTYRYIRPKDYMKMLTKDFIVDSEQIKIGKVQKKNCDSLSYFSHCNCKLFSLCSVLIQINTNIYNKIISFFYLYI